MSWTAEVLIKDEQDEPRWVKYRRRFVSRQDAAKWGLYLSVRRGALGYRQVESSLPVNSILNYETNKPVWLTTENENG